MAPAPHLRRLAAIAATLLAFSALAGCESAAPVPHYAVVDRGGDSDNDGIADADDACPDEPEDGLPPKANDGCPADDADNDGILGAADKCPNAKEDGLPPDPTDGCPSNDADGDGVADARDKCPNAAEDNLPPDPNDGCPAGDADGDGIVDALDRCPNQPETWNGYRDEDGCPDAVPLAIIVFDGESSTVYVPEGQRLRFDADSADLTAADKQTIDKVAEVLRQRLEIGRIEIEGHASSKGDKAHNLALTDRRAQSVAKALISKGVSPSRLVPIGYGGYCSAQGHGGDGVDVLIKTVVVNGVWQKVQRGCWKAQAAGIDPTKRRPINNGGGSPAPRVTITPGGA